MEIPDRSNIMMKRKGEAIVINAPKEGLQEISFDANRLTIQVSDWMRSQTCGMCGRGDGETIWEFSTPSQRVTNNAVSFAHSWVLSKDSCRNEDGCHMRRASVKLQSRQKIRGEDSKCYSVDLVMQCLSGCVPVKTKNVTLGFHCLPVESNVPTDASITEKSIDLWEKAESHEESPGFASVKTYVYKYEAFLMSGLPEEGLAKAGVKIQSKILISATTEANVYIMKLADPELFEYSGIWPKDQFKPAAKLSSVLAAKLSAPIKFEYLNGDVSKVYAPSGMPAAVLNIYKGVLNILQMNVKQTQNVYELHELGSHGMCKTSYTITEDQKADRIRLTKTKDLNHCQQKIIKDIGLDFMEKCSECQTRGKSLRGSASYNYVMKQEHHGALILEATSAEVIQYSPFNILNGAVQMQAKQKLKLMDIEKTLVEPASADYVHYGSLQYDFDKEYLQSPINILRVHNAEAQIIDSLKQLVAANAARVQEDAPLKFIELVQLLRVARLESIKSIWAHFIRDRPEYRYWFLSAVPSVRTYAALKFLKEKIEIDEMTHTEAALALMTAMQSVKADQETIMLAEEMARNARVRANPMLQKVVILGWGSMVGRYCDEHPTCSDKFVKPIQDLLVEALGKANEDLITAAVKSLHNAGHPASIKAIQKLLPGFSSQAANLPLRVHVDAVLALRRIARKEPRKVQEIAIQLLMDKNQHPELRITAAIVLFETKMPMGMVTAVANSLLKGSIAEGNLQVASFVYSYIKAMTRTTAPDYASIAAACNVALRFLNPKLARLDCHYSKAFHVDTFYNPYIMGAAASVYHINDAATVFPKFIMAKTRAYMAGVYVDAFEIGVRTEGLQEAFLKRQRVSSENEDRVNKIKQAMRALSDWKANPSRKPLASIFVKLFGQEISFINIDKDKFDEILQLANRNVFHSRSRDALRALMSGVTKHFVTPMRQIELRRILPTTVGVPVELSLLSAAVAGAAVDLHINTSPPLPASFHPAALLETDIDIRATFAPSFSMQSYVTVGINTPFIQAALTTKAKVQTAIPAQIKAKIDIAKGKFKVEFLSAQGIDKLASAHVETFAVVRNSEDSAAVKKTPVIPPEALRQLSIGTSARLSRIASTMTGGMSASSEVLHADLPKKLANKVKLPKAYKKKMQVYSKTFGFKAVSEIVSHNAAFIRNDPLYRIMGNHTFSLKVTPATRGPVIDRIEVELQFGDKAAENMMKEISLSEEEEVLEDKKVLLKLRKILNNTSSSSSSGSSSSSRSRSSSSSSSSSRSSRSSSSVSSSRSSSSSSSSRSSKSSQSSSSRSSKSSQSSSSSSSLRRSSRKASILAPAVRKSKSHSKSSSSNQSSQGSNSTVSSSSSNASHRSSSSSSSSRSSAWSKSNHQSAHAISKQRSSHSSARSFDSIYNKAKYLASTVSPALSIAVRAVRVDLKKQGYQLAAYLDKDASRLQVIFARVAEKDKFKLCADAVKLSSHKLVTKMAWGTNCKQYAVMGIAETGMMGEEPAVRLKLSWDIVPKQMRRYAKKVYQYVYYMAPEYGARIVKVRNPRNQAKLTISAASETSLNVVLQTRKATIYKPAVRLPVALPIGETAVELEAYQKNWADQFSYLFAKANTAECIVKQDTVTTFNNKTIPNNMPESCHQVLAQDCTDELKFIVQQMKKRDQYSILVMVANIEIGLSLKGNTVVPTINGMEIPDRSNIMMKRKGEAIVINAPKEGLQEISFDANRLTIQVSDWMRSQTCGMCGRGDGETIWEFSTPSQRVTNNAVSFAHSWVLSKDSCRNEDGCHMRRASVKLQSRQKIRGEDSKCYSVDLVMQCLSGCVPVKTKNVTLGFHCLPVESNVPTDASITEKSIDLWEKAESHEESLVNDLEANVIVRSEPSSTSAAVR
ncbi:vitellogenin-2-like [Pholidichthys leucotaenia]